MQVTSLSLPPLPFQVVQSKIKDKGRKREKDRSSSYGVSKKPTKGTLPVKRGRNAIKPFFEEDVFPSSLPLHTRNPHAIYKDIQRFARQNKLKEALTILDYMDQQGIPVNVTTFSSLIVACVRSKSLAEGKQIHAHVRINGLESNEFLKTRLVHMYTSCGSIEDAKMIFDTCCTKTVYPYNALIRGAVISGRRRYLDVISTFSEMREIGVEGNEYTFSSMIKSFAGASALRQGLRTHALLIKNGFKDSSPQVELDAAHCHHHDPRRCLRHRCCSVRRSSPPSTSRAALEVVTSSRPTTSPPKSLLLGALLGDASALGEGKQGMFQR